MADLGALERIESFPYRHRVAEVMSSPLATALPSMPVAEASRLMANRRISSLAVIDGAGRPVGIVTERDMLHALGHHQADCLALPLSALMSSPVATVRQDAFLYIAMGRMDRLKLRHLVAVDSAGQATGMITVRNLLGVRAGSALALGDEVMSAGGGMEMATVRPRLPSLARGLLAEGIDGLGVAAVASSVLRDMTVRAAQLAEEAMRRERWGPAPAPWCLLLLGSGGRRESLFAADQDNAIIHAGDAAQDGWFAEAGMRINDLLDQAGVPLCKGGVMARNPEWRQTAEEWARTIERWMRSADGPELLSVDIFVDFRPVHGDYSLAERLRGHLLEQAARAPLFLHGMASKVAEMGAPLGVLGQFKTRDGRIDLKLGGLWPLVGAARLLALKHRIPATSTADRFRALAAGGHMAAGEAEGYVGHYEFMLRILIGQQIADADAGRPLSGQVDPKRLDAAGRARLKEAFKALDPLKWALRNALSTV